MRTLVGVGFAGRRHAGRLAVAAHVAGRRRGVPARRPGAVAGADRPRVPQLRAAGPADRVGHRRGHRPPRARRDRRAVSDGGAGLAARTAEDQRASATCTATGTRSPRRELRDLMAGYPGPWWVVGGWAVEAFTGVPRFHEDIDLVVFADDVPALREQLGDVFHLWSNDGGTFRILDDETPEPLRPAQADRTPRGRSSPWRQLRSSRHATAQGVHLRPPRAAAPLARSGCARTPAPRGGSTAP